MHAKIEASVDAVLKLLLFSRLATEFDRTTAPLVDSENACDFRGQTIGLFAMHLRGCLARRWQRMERIYGEAAFTITLSPDLLLMDLCIRGAATRAGLEWRHMTTVENATMWVKPGSVIVRLDEDRRVVNIFKGECVKLGRRIPFHRE